MQGCQAYLSRLNLHQTLLSLCLSVCLSLSVLLCVRLSAPLCLSLSAPPRPAPLCVCVCVCVSAPLCESVWPSGKALGW